MNKIQSFGEFGWSLSRKNEVLLLFLWPQYNPLQFLPQSQSVLSTLAEACTFLLSPPTHLQPLLLDFIHLLFLHQRQEFPRLVDGAHEVLQQTLSLVDAAAAAAVFVWERTETVRAHLQASWDPAATRLRYLSHEDPELRQHTLISVIEPCHRTKVFT